MVAVLAILALIGIAFFGAYVLRFILPTDHALQSFLTDDAIEARTSYMVKNYKFILGGVLIAYFTIVTIIYS